MDFRLIFIIAFAGFVVSVILLALIVTFLNEIKRAKNMVAQAKELGFQPASKDVVTNLNFEQTKFGNKQKFYNVSEGTFSGLPVITFDMNITIGNLGYGTGTSHGNIFKSSGIIFKKDGPVFELQPRSPLSRNAYNEYFSLKGDTSFMDDTLAQHIGKNYAVESTGTHVLFVPSGKRIEDLNEGLKTAYAILQEMGSKQ